MLGRPEALAALCAAAARAQRLVLLGDVIELRQGPRREALEAARGPLSELASALAPGTEVVLVPGNHDHALLSPWLERRARDRPPSPVGLDAAVDWRAGEPLARIARWFEPGAFQVRYPGCWLAPGVYATHGHYADRHTTVPMLERLGAGAMARIVRRGDGRAGTGAEPAYDGGATAEDYEAILAPIYAWIDAVAQTGGRHGSGAPHGASARAWRVLAPDRPADRDARGPTGRVRGLTGRARGLTGRARGRGLALAFPALIAALNRAGIGPLSADLSGESLRRAGLAAIGAAVDSLRIEARHVVFGHTHRAGPLPGDDPSEWMTPSGARLTNSGSWVHAPNFLGPDPLRSPYRAGFCVTLDGDGPPALGNLLDGLAAAGALTPPARA